MDRRYPSSALDSRLSIRHRSGAYSPALRSPPTEARARRHSSLGQDDTVSELDWDQTLTVQVEDADDLGSAPTILLVRQSRAAPLTPSLPAFARNALGISSRSPELTRSPDLPRERGSPYLSPRRHEADAISHFSPVPLTPRPPQPPRGASACSVATTHTTTSHVSRLPTPNFTAHAGEAIQSYLPSLFSFSGAHGAAPGTPVTSRCPTLGRGSSSTTSDGSTATSRSSSSIHASEKHRPELLPSFSTTDKFTKKFPRPRSVKNLTFTGGHKAALAATMLEEGEGLGMDTVDRWPVHKWWLLLSVCTVFVYGLISLLCAVLTWFRAWPQADVMYVADNDVLVLITLSSSILLLTFLVGISGTILNSRPLLAIYAVLLWPALLSILAIGYTSYKRYAFSLDRKLNMAWSQWYTPVGRLIVQDSLRCCGYYDSLHEATASTQCYPRTPLPGCKGKLYRFEHENLATIWSAAFALVPVHIINIVISLLCANHVTQAFGKGIMPKRYWLSGADVRADAERLMGTIGGVRPIVRPGLTRPPLSSIFREDREESQLAMDEEWDPPEILRPGSVGLGLQSRRRDD